MLYNIYWTVLCLLLAHTSAIYHKNYCIMSIKQKKIAYICKHNKLYKLRLVNAT